jgi:hypothetical protein
LKGSGITLFQSKPKYVKEIRDLLKRLNYTYTETIVKKEKLNSYSNNYNATMDAHRFYVSKREFFSILELCDKNNLNKDLHHMTKAQFKLLWETMMKANGSRQKNKNGKLCTTRKTHADFFMHMASVRGFAMMYGNYETDNGLKVYNLGMREKQYIQLTKRDIRGAKFELKKAKVQELVWCVTNKIGTIITRRKGKIAVLGNCPVKEGFRIVETVILARPTMSLGKCLQQIGRALRPSPNKPHALIIDHVGNVKRHGLPCMGRDWSLERPGRKKKKSRIRTCHECLSVYERVEVKCPFCGAKVESTSTGEGRVPPEMCDGDLVLIDSETLAQMEYKTILEDPNKMAERVTHVAGVPAGKKAFRTQSERIQTQQDLKDLIAIWAGKQNSLGLDDRQIHKQFYLDYDMTINQALSVPKLQMTEIMNDIKTDLGIAIEGEKI